jgi:hypothetical protein
MRGTSAVLLLCAGLLAACSEPMTHGSAGVGVRTDAAGIEILNQRNRTIYYFAADRQTAALILWGACDRPADCPRVEPNERRRVPASEIQGWGTSDEVIVYWWHLLPQGDDEFRVDSIRHIVATR